MKNEQESNVQATADQRRRFLRLFGATAALLPITAIVGCSDDAPTPPPSPQPSDAREPAAAADPAPQAAMEQAVDDAEAMVSDAAEDVEAAVEDAADEAETMMEEAADEAESMMDDAADDVEAAVDDMTAQPAAGDMPPVDPNDPTAQALGYQHDAANVDASKYPDRDPAHRCANCILYQGGPDSEWGGCALFPGKAVNAQGWCSSYTPKAG